jgi:3D (Asp-Asp-Asp) domain-containing protein
MSIIGAFMGFFLLASAGETLTSPAPTALVAPSVPTYFVQLTAYNAVPGQTDDSPNITASGAFSNPEIIAARSRNLAEELPFGTIIELDGSSITANNTCGFNVVSGHIGYRVIADTMNARYTDRIDILFDTNATYKKASGKTINVANVLGICNGVTIRVVGYVDINHVPATQAALAEIVNSQTKALAAN